MKATASERYLSLLAIQRMTALRSSERLAVLSLLESGAELACLSSRDIEHAVGRPLAGRLPEARVLLAQAEGDALLLDRLGARFASWVDAGYPALLREIAQPPFGVYLRGWDLDQAIPSVSIVGTRCPTGLGMETALALAGEIAEAGLAVVSGLARGIDGAAHRGALRHGGRTCAVLPCGIDEVYPAAHQGLAATILESGGLLASEYPPGTRLHKGRFPERNRLISGFSRGLVVVEAPSGSGALITADFALDQGRDVFVAAACLEGPRSAGLDRLFSEGARPLCSGWDIIREWGLEGLLPVHALPGFPRLGSGAAGHVSPDGGRVGSHEGKALAESLRAELKASAMARAGAR